MKVHVRRKGMVKSSKAWEWWGWIEADSLADAAMFLASPTKAPIESCRLKGDGELGDRFFLTPDGTGGYGLEIELQTTERPLTWEVV